MIRLIIDNVKLLDSKICGNLNFREDHSITEDKVWTNTILDMDLEVTGSRNKYK